VNPFAITRAVTESLETTTPPVFKVSNPLPNPESFPIRSVPPVTVTPPLNAFAPPKVRIEDPAFVSANALAPIAPPNVTTLGVVSVTFDVNAPAPLSVNDPLFVASPIVIVPPSEYPFAIEYAVVDALDKVPAVIVKVPVPNAALLPTRTAPDPIVTPPVNVFTPLNTKLPVPPRTKDPPVPLITPLNVVVELPPTVSAFPCKLTLPVPAKLANVSLAPNFRVPGELTVTAPVSAIATPPFNVSVPAVTVVAPVYVFAPVNVSSPVPAFVKLPLPLTTPFQFTALWTVTVEFAVIAPAPPNVNAPLFVKLPNVTFAPMVKPFANVRAVNESLETVTPEMFIVNKPLPSPVSLPIWRVPPVTATPPVNVFAPPSVRVDAPAFVREDAPESVPLNTTGAKAVNVVPDVKVPKPENVSVPVYVAAAPMVTVPEVE
jgi:hypothetical protein